ncbi:hypothetical protein COLO4_16165 [Corchorus olitorius]|uniref:Uncharacterized protein n=1 Tax=Corchorus olitorius TaxID=93759 RepID=A0A1R3JIR5_9ROSI|nr:hypothetical protein COLO4_16165 [Corchorus olitorius]
MADPRNIERRHRIEFPQWFEKYAITLHNEGSELVNDQLLDLARGLDKRVHRYKSILLNGWRFNTRNRELQLKSQNSGIYVKGDDSTGDDDMVSLDRSDLATTVVEGNSVNINIRGVEEEDGDETDDDESMFTDDYDDGINPVRENKSSDDHDDD